MLITSHKILNLLAKLFKHLSELLMWGYVAVGGMKALTEGVTDLSTFLIGSSLGVMSLYLILYLFSNACKLMDNYLLTSGVKNARFRSKSRNSDNRRKGE